MMIRPNSAFVVEAVPELRERSRGFNLLEVTLFLTIILTILLGVMASISNASLAERNSSENLQSQLLLDQVLNEIQANIFDNLITFNGQYVTSGNHRADIRVTLITSDLAQIQVDVTSPVFTDISNRAVLLLSNTST